MVWQRNAAIIWFSSLVVLSGYIGQVSLAQMSFVGVGAFVVWKVTFERDLKIWTFTLGLYRHPGPDQLHSRS